MTILRLAASVAHFSTHPLARAIVAEADKQQLSRISAKDFLNVPGLGHGSVDRRKPNFHREQAIDA